MQTRSKDEVANVFREFARKKYSPTITVLFVTGIAGLTGYTTLTVLLVAVLIFTLWKELPKLEAATFTWSYYRDRNINIRFRGFDEIILLPHLSRDDALQSIMSCKSEDYWPLIPLPGNRIGYLFCTFWPNESYGVIANPIKDIQHSATNFYCDLYVTDAGISIVIQGVLVPSLYHLTVPFERITAIEVVSKLFSRLLWIALSPDRHFFLSVNRTASYTNVGVLDYLKARATGS